MTGMTGLTGDEIVDAVEARMVTELGLDDVSDYVVRSIVMLACDVLSTPSPCDCYYINDEHLSGWSNAKCPTHGAHA